MISALRLCSALALVCGSWTLPARALAAETLPQELVQLPAELLPLREEIEGVYRHFLAADPAYGRTLEADAARKAQSQRWLPVLALQSGIDRSQKKSLANENEINRGSPQTYLQYGVSLKQNLFSGGTDLKRSEGLRLSETAAQLRHQISWKSAVKQWILDTIQIQFHTELVKFSEEAHQQAQQLNQLAKRKAASGFLGKRELLESEREVLRTSEEVQRNKSNLGQLTQISFLTYGVRNSVGAKSKALEALIRVSNNVLSIPTTQLVDAQAPQSLLWLLAQTETKIAEQELGRTRSGRLTPSIDASVGFSESRQLGAAQSLSANTQNSDRTQQWSVALNGSLQLNPPITFGMVDEALQRLMTAKQTETKTQRELALAFTGSIERLRIVVDRQNVTAKLVGATSKIREQNQRLFEAGELPLDRLILSQQDLDRDRKLLVTLANEESLLRAEMGLSTLWNLPPNSSSAAQP